MTRIKKIFWCDLPDAFASPEFGQLFAIWPSPIGSDACFEKAGFRDFSDDYGDEQWDVEWREALNRLINCLSRVGTPNLLNNGDVQMSTTKWWHWLVPFMYEPIVSVNLSPLERILLSTEDDRLDEAVVAFGAPPLITVRSSAGHPIVWLNILPQTSISVELLTREIAEPRPVTRLDLDWHYLVMPTSHSRRPS